MSRAVGSTKTDPRMSSLEVETALNELIVLCTANYETCKTAGKNGKSLSGDNPYGKKFQQFLVTVSQIEARLRTTLNTLTDDEFGKVKFGELLGTLKSRDTKVPQRGVALRDLELIVHSKIVPAVNKISASPIPETEHVLPMAVVHNTRGYIEKITLQINGCYEHQWFDACSVMVRKLIEILIMEVYEANSQTSDIKDINGDYLTLSY